MLVLSLLALPLDGWVEGGWVLASSSCKEEARCPEMRPTRWESQEDPPDKEMATQYSCLENPMDRGAWRLQSISSVQSLSRVRFFATPWTAAHQASLSTTNSQSLLKFISIEVHYGLSQDVEYSSLCSTAGPCWLPILCVIVCIC